MVMIRIVLADDHPLVRTGIRITLETENDVCIVGEAANGYEAQQLCQSLLPDILLLDLGMYGPNSIETVQFIKAHCPAVKPIILTAYDDEVFVRALIRLGVAGYILKDEVPEILLGAIRVATTGGTWLSPHIAGILAAPQLSDEKKADSLTERERDVLLLITRGYSNLKIAHDLTIAEGTVKNHIVSIYQKMNIHSRAEAVIRGLELIEPSSEVSTIKRLGFAVDR
jgi:DNA-binding NarL/FixJ family response regulator